MAIKVKIYLDVNNILYNQLENGFASIYIFYIIVIRCLIAQFEIVYYIFCKLLNFCVIFEHFEIFLNVYLFFNHSKSYFLNIISTQ